MKKKIFGGIAIAAVALALAFNLSVKQDGPKLSALAMENVEALAEESGTSTDAIVCYNSYNSCWFWDCEHIWRCSGIECYDVKCDSKSDTGKCTVKRS